MKNSFNLFLNKVFEASTVGSFIEGSNKIDAYVDSLSITDFVEIAEEIGTIPEKIIASSTEEKMYSKASDIVLARCFREIGLNSRAVSERGDAADVIATSNHGYSLVADAKAFRLSRTAKNQKDFKINSLSAWRGTEHEYAVLVSPYYQYPSNESQIYFDSLEKNVCILSWEHILYLIKNNIKENVNLNLETIWNAPTMIQRAHNISFANRKQNLFPFTNEIFARRCTISIDEFNSYMANCKNIIITRSQDEIETINGEIREIQALSKDEAIERLLSAKKTSERLDAIDKFISSL